MPRPERRTALVSKELARFNVDIAALSETRLANEGKIEECSGYTIFWSGKSENERRIHGVGFAIKTKLVKQHHLIPKAINERLMTMRIPLHFDTYLTVVSAYAPTLDSGNDAKENFYQELHSIISAVNAKEKLIILGDFNARVGRDHLLWKGIIGRHGVGKCNDNGLLLLSLCAELQLTITNSLFELPERQKTTWQHPRSKHWHVLDYAITRKRDRQDFLITRVMRGADDCWTDHRLLLSRCRLKIKKPVRVINITKRKFDTKKLSNPETSKAYRERVHKQLMTATNHREVSGEWKTIRDTITDAAAEIVGYSAKKHQDWFDDCNTEISSLINVKRQLRLRYEDNPTPENKKRFLDHKAECQRALRSLQNRWWQEKSTELQAYSDSRDMRNFFAGTKQLFGPARSHHTVLKSADNQELTDPEEIIARWKEHFSELLNRRNHVHDDFLRYVPQFRTRHWMSNIPTLEEFKQAMKAIKPFKSPGPDNIPLELLAHGGEALTIRLHRLFLRIWEEEEVPADLKDANIVAIFKKGDRGICGNYRGISLLSIVGKILARILLNRLVTLTDEILPETQCGFRTNRGTIDMIFCARQIQEKCREQQRPLSMIFYDLEKAFDGIPRPAMWEVLRRFGCSEKFTSLIRALHDGMTGRVQYQSGLTEPFPITGGLKQGCVLAPTLFSIYLAAMYYEIGRETPGIEISTRSDGGLFNLSRLKARTKVKHVKITELQYADDNATPAHLPEDLQISANTFSNAYTRFGLKINLGKTEVLVQTPPNTDPPNTSVSINGVPIKQVDHFKYLGSILASDATCRVDIENRIRSAHAAYGKLCKRVFQNRDLTLKTKILVYQAVVISTLLYACETWTLYRKDIQKLERFHQSKLRNILGIGWEDRITNNSVLARSNTASIESMILRHRLRWSGHVLRMDQDRLPHQLLYGELQTGRRPRGAPKRRYKDQLKDTLKRTNISVETWEEVAMERAQWSHNIRSGIQHFETARTNKDQEKRNNRKQRQANPPTQPTIPCVTCGRLFRAKIGLISHQRTHQPRRT